MNPEQLKVFSELWEKGFVGECFGVKSDERKKERKLSAEDGVCFSIDRINYCVPSQNQHLPSCVGEATGNAIELIIRDICGENAIESGKQINGEYLYKLARNRYYNDWQYTEGLSLFDGTKIAKCVGILPEYCCIQKIDPTPRAISNALIKGAILQASPVDSSWVNPKEDGLVYFDMLSFAGLHATIIVGIWNKTGKIDDVEIIFQNSWGSNWGWNGLGRCKWSNWIKAHNFAESDLLLMNFLRRDTSWNTWREYLI
jgi:hypothetical protein